MDIWSSGTTLASQQEAPRSILGMPYDQFLDFGKNSNKMDLILWFSYCFDLKEMWQYYNLCLV